VLGRDGDPLQVRGVLDDLETVRAKAEGDDLAFGLRDKTELRATLQVIGNLADRPVVVGLVRELVAANSELVYGAEVARSHRTDGGAHGRCHPSRAALLCCKSTGDAGGEARDARGE